MNPHDLLDHLRRYFPTELGSRAVDYLSPSCPRSTATNRAVLACAALKAIGVQSVPHYAGDWKEAGVLLIEGELHSLSQTYSYISAEQANQVRQQMRTTLTPHGLLSLLCATWKAGKHAAARYAAARLDRIAA
jgi:hypothetical protein